MMQSSTHQSLRCVSVHERWLVCTQVFKTGDGGVIDSREKAEVWLGKRGLPRGSELAKVFDQVGLSCTCSQCTSTPQSQALWLDLKPIA